MTDRTTDMTDRISNTTDRTTDMTDRISNTTDRTSVVTDGISAVTDSICGHFRVIENSLYKKGPHHF